MVKILQPKIEASGFLDLIAIGAVKQIEERILSPYIGNATIWSGLIKGIAGSVIESKFGKVGKIIGGAFGVDAGEDLAIGLLGAVGGGGIGGGGTGGAQANAW